MAQAASATKKKVVLDTAAFIKQAKLESLGDEFFTISEVLSEIRDSKARMFLDTLPVKVVQKDPTTQALAAVVSFSKKTGDFPSLSKTDLKLLALVYTLENEARGSAAHLRTEPTTATVIDEKAKRATPTFKPLTPNAVITAAKTIAAPATAPLSADPLPSPAEQKPLPSQPEELTDTMDDESKNRAPAHAATEPKKKRKRGPRKKKAAKTVDSTSATLDLTRSDPDVTDTSVLELASECPAEEIPSPVESGDAPELSSNLDQKDESKSEGELGMGTWDDDDQSSGWVTPDNLQTYTRAYSGQTEEDEAAENSWLVTCVTADFAMQNVLLQMGLHLTSVDGFAIKALQRWILRCYGCKLVVKDMNKLFCPRCGNSTLHRVQYTVDNDGNMVLQNVKTKISVRGSKYSVPLPKGGRNASNLILSEGQLPSYRPRPKVKDLMNDEALFLDPHGRTANKDVVIGYGRKNPNEPRKHFGKKNKAKKQGF